ncbi:MAG: CvpA family protein [Clostridia bacterium]|nr:CvpA family protein [Clostridia bacterium]
MEHINAIVFGIFALFGIIGALGGFSKGLIRSAVKVVTIILAFVVAFSVTPLVLSKAYELALPTIDDLLAKFGDVFVASPTLKEFFPTLVQALIKPIVFIVVFAVCLLVAGLVRAIVNLLLKPVLPKKKGLIGRLGGLAFGLVAGVMVALFFVFPIAGYCTVAPSVYTNVSDIVSTEEKPIDPAVEEAIINLPNNKSIKITNDLAGSYFKKLVTYKDGEKEVSALDDLVYVTSLVPPALRFVNSVGEIETMDHQAIRDVATILGKNDKWRTIATEIVNYASQKWIDNESFLGFNLQEKFDPDYKLVLDLILDDLATCTPDTIVGVLNDIANTIETAQTVFFPPILSLVNSAQNIETLDDQAIRDIGQALGEHPKLRAMATEIVNSAATKWLNNEPFLGFNLQEMLGDELKTVFDPMLNNMATCTENTLVDIINGVADSVKAVKDIMPSVDSFVNSSGSIETMDDQAIRDIGAVLANNDSFCSLATGLVNTAATKWLNNESFLGFNIREKLGDEIKPLFDPMLNDMATCTKDNLVGIINDMADTIKAVKDIMPSVDSFVNSSGSIETMDDQAIRDIGAVLAQNDGFRSMAAGVVNQVATKWLNGEEFMGINLAEKLGTELKPVFDPMLNDMATCTKDNIVGVLNDMADTIQAVKPLIPAVKEFVDSVGDLSSINDQAIRNIVEILADNEKLRILATDTINTAATKWLNNEAFMGINLAEKLDPELKSLFDPILADMSACTPDTIVDVLNNMADSVKSVQSIIPSAKEFVNSVSSISTLNDQAVRDIGKVLEDNDEFRAMATDVINTAATKWLNGEEFMGYNLQEKFDPDYQVVLDLMLKDLSECTPDNVVEVLNKIANSIETVREVFG